MLLLGVQQSDSVIYVKYVFSFGFFSIIGYYKILNIILCTLLLCCSSVTSTFLDIKDLGYLWLFSVQDSSYSKACQAFGVLFCPGPSTCLTPSFAPEGGLLSVLFPRGTLFSAIQGIASSKNSYSISETPTHVSMALRTWKTKSSVIFSFPTFFGCCSQSHHYKC